MNTWTDSGLSEAGMIGAMLAIGVEARLPDGPARSGRGGSRRGDVPQRGDLAQRGEMPQRGGRRRAVEPGFVPPAADGGPVPLGVPAADYADPYAAPYASASASGAHAAVEPAAEPTGVPTAVPEASSLTGSFPLSGVARLYTPEPVPLPSEPLPPEPVASDGDRDGLHSSTDGFLAGGFSSSALDSSWDSLGAGESSGDLSGSWSRPVPITPSSSLDGSSPSTMVREPVSPAVSAPTSLLPMPKTPASHRAESTGSGSGRHSSWDAEKPAEAVEAARETFNVESSTLGSLDSSDLFAALSRRGR